MKHFNKQLTNVLQKFSYLNVWNVTYVCILNLNPHNLYEANYQTTRVLASEGNAGKWKIKISRAGGRAIAAVNLNCSFQPRKAEEEQVTRPLPFQVNFNTGSRWT